MLKPQRPIISDSLSIAARIPITIFTQIVKQPVAVSTPVPDEPDDEFYDAPDHFSDNESDEFDEEQAPDDDISQMVIKFHPLSVWNNSEDNRVEYILPPNFGEFSFVGRMKRKSHLSLLISRWRS